MSPAFGRRGTSHRRIAAVCAAILLVASLAGCVTQQGGATGKLGRSIDDVESALASAEVGLRQDQEGLTLPGASSTLLEDMLEEIHTTAGDIGKLTPKTAIEADRQDRALEMASEAERALATARANLEEDGRGGGSTDDDLRALADLGHALAIETQGWAP